MIQSSPTQTPITIERDDARVLREFIAEHELGDAAKIVELTPDASVRRYYRVPYKRDTAIVALYPEPFDAATQPFLDVTKLFNAADLPVPEILHVDPPRGLILQEDLGDQQLRDALSEADEASRERLLEEAIALIARIQATTELAFTHDSIASRLAFDTEKLLWELNYFVQHYFGSLRGRTLTEGETAELNDELSEIATELSARLRVLCHRDFHAANLVVDRAGKLRIIDYQDARMGAASYDLVSLLLDRQLAPPPPGELRERRLFFLEERRRAGLAPLDPDEFAREFRLMTVQRCLKAAGTFSYQTAICGRGAVYGEFIRPMFEIVLQAAVWLNRFPRLQSLLKSEIDAPA